MDQMNLLWAYQAEDMKADRLEREIRRSPLRQKMENDRTQYMEKQKQHKQIQDQVAQMGDRKDAIRDALTRSQDQLNALQKRYEVTPPTELEAVRAMAAEVNRCLDTITRYEKELEKISERVRDCDKRADAIRREGARLRAEFEQLKAQFDEQYPPQKAALEKQRAVVEQKKAEIDPVLLEQYLSAKKHITPPLSRLTNGQCSGCNTSLPSAVLNQLRNADEKTLVACESCGRFIIKG